MSRFTPPAAGAEKGQAAPDVPAAVDFVSAFARKRFEDEACTLTVEEVKRLCWADARRLKDLHGPDVFCCWARQIEAFAGGREEVQNTTMQITAVYLDYAVGYIPKEGAERLLSTLEGKMETLLAEYRPVQQGFEDSMRRTA